VGGEEWEGKGRPAQTRQGPVTVAGCRRRRAERGGGAQTWPGGRMASNLSTPNMPRLDSVKVPAQERTSQQAQPLRTI